MKQNLMPIGIAICMLLLFGCDNNKDEYYERPSWKEPSIYKLLQSEGKFDTYLKCIDKTEYRNILDGAGLYTVFAPNDEAFNAFLTAKAYGSIDDIPAAELKKLVAYSIVMGKWTSEHLSDKISSSNYVTGAFKRRTVYYTMPHRDPEFDNNWVFDEPLQGTYASTVKNYQTLLTMQNYKYLPVFTDKYFASLTLDSENNYHIFYPNAAYTGKNVDAGTILKEDIICENGIIHEVSTVSEPKKNMDEILNESAYSGFNSLLDFQSSPDNYVFKEFREAPADLLETFKLMLPNEDIDKVYIKGYSKNSTAKLSFSTLSENIRGESSYDSESLGNTLFVPENDVLEQYIQTKLLKYYDSREKLPIDVITTLINTHMVNELVWGDNYGKVKNSTGEYVNGGTGKTFADGGITEKTMASNGFVYQIDHVIKSRFFETVYSEIYLNPAHQWLNTAYVKYFASGLREDLMKSVLNDAPNQRFTLLNFSDELLKADGFVYNGEDNTFSNTEVGSGDSRLQRLMKLHIFPGQLGVQTGSGALDVEIKSFDDLPKISQYEDWSFIVSLSGDMLRYKTGLGMQAAGNIWDDTYVNFTPVDDEYNNGQIYNVDRLLEYAPRANVTGSSAFGEINLMYFISLARTQNPNVKTFVDYLERVLLSSDGYSLAGISSTNYYTILMPNNTAMTQAINNGYIMPLDSVTPDKVNYLAQATQFVNSHILSGQIFADDGLTYIYPVNTESPNKAVASTLLKVTDEAWGLVNQSTLVQVEKNASGLLIFTPMDIKSAGQVAVAAGTGMTTNLRVQRGKPAQTIYQNSYRSNRIASKAVIHEINNFFTFTVNTNN